MKLLSKKVIIVTGGAGLLGKEFISAIIRNGGIGIIVDIDDKAGKKAIEEMKDENCHHFVHFYKLDITDKESIIKMIDYVDNKFGRIDGLVNNAYPKNYNYGRKFFNVEYEDFCENVTKHLGGYFLMSQQIAKYFLKQKYGNIINIASIYGVIPPRFEIYINTPMTMPVEYAVIKSAVIHLTKYLAKFFKGSNIRVNTISPGGVFNNQPIQFSEQYNNYSLNKGMLDKEDVSGSVIFLLSDMSKYINGQNIIVDDGWTL